MNDSNTSKTPQMMRNIFGIVMIIVYIGMGVLFFINFFQFNGSWAWLPHQHDAAIPYITLFGAGDHRSYHFETLFFGELSFFHM